MTDYLLLLRKMALEGNETPHILVFVDEAGFNLDGGRRGRNIILQPATVNVPGQRGGNKTTCAAIFENGVATYCTVYPQFRPYNTQKLLIFLDRLHTAWVPENKRGLERPHLPHYVIMWDNVNFHLGPLMTWFTTQDAHGATTTILSSGRLISFFPLVVECMNIGAQDQRSLLHAIDKACKEITGDQCRGWLRHLCHFFPC